MLASIGRCYWKQVRLGKGAPDAQQKGINGNTILFAQPTANISFMELPPPTDALVDTMNIAFARSTQDLSRAYWATVKRSEYMRIVRERRQQCATFAHVSVRAGPGRDTASRGWRAGARPMLHAVSGRRGQSSSAFVGASIQGA